MILDLTEAEIQAIAGIMHAGACAIGIKAMTVPAALAVEKLESALKEETARKALPEPPPIVAT